MGVLLRLPDNFQLRDPDEPERPTKPVTYNRLLPLGARKVIEQGYALPLPFGISLLGVDNTQRLAISDLEVALGKGTAPPPICAPIDPCGTDSANFNAGVDAVTATLGATGVYSLGYWWGLANLSGTLTAGSNSDTDINSCSGNLRAGRRFVFGNGYIISPYFGISYLDVDSVVEGMTGLQNVFPDSDDLCVRYRIRQENLDKWSGALGLNLGFANGTSIQVEYNRNTGGGERLVLAASARF